jgi:hypothetical protein
VKAIDPDAMLGEFGRHATSERLDSALGRRVVRPAREHHSCLDGTDIDDRATLAASYHVPCHDLTAKKRSPKVGIGDSFPLGFFEFEKWDDRFYAGIVDQHVDGAQCFRYRFDHCFDLVTPGNIRLNRDRLAPEVANRPGDILSLLVAPCKVHCNVRPGRCHGFGDAPANAPARTCNEYNLVLQSTCHASS